MRRDTFPGIGTWPQPISPTAEMVWCGARHRRVVTTAVRLPVRPALLWMRMVSRASAASAMALVLGRRVSSPDVSWAAAYFLLDLQEPSPYARQRMMAAPGIALAGLWLQAISPPGMAHSRCPQSYRGTALSSGQTIVCSLLPRGPRSIAGRRRSSVAGLFARLFPRS